MNCGTREVEIVASSYGVMVMCDILGSSACSNANMTGEQCIATMDNHEDKVYISSLIPYNLLTSRRSGL